MTIYEPNLDAVARTALSLIDDVREVDPDLTCAVLAGMCRAEPGRMAQTIMALAIWVDPDTTVGELANRAERAASGARRPRLAADREVHPEGVCSRCGATLTVGTAVRNGRDAEGRQRWRCRCTLQTKTRAAA